MDLEKNIDTVILEIKKNLKEKSKEVIKEINNCANCKNMKEICKPAFKKFNKDLSL
ncbi:44295_t:CDS:1, partial [Gigaspora margarita]